MPPYQKLPPLIPWDEADEQGLMVLGTCDWGGCDREAWGMRWSRDTEEYLTVCQPCSRTSWKPGHGRRP